MKYLLKQMGLYLVAAWAALTLNFLLPRAMPGDPVMSLISRMRGQIKPEQIASIKAAFGFTDGPLWQQYLQYLNAVFHGDFGISISSYPVKVSDIISTGLFWTILLGVVSLLISFIVGNLLGVFITWRRGGVADTILPGLLTFMGSFPYFWLALVMLFLFAFKLGWFPLRHAYADELSPAFTWTFIQSVLVHMVLPAGSVVLVSVGGWMMTMRSTMVGVLSEDYIVMAEAKGLPQRMVMFAYAMRNAILPNITQFGMSLGFILSGQLLTEMVFSYPGLGFYLVKAVNTQDYSLMQALFLMITLAVLVANFIVDLLYVRLDPRVRAG